MILLILIILSAIIAGLVFLYFKMQKSTTTTSATTIPTPIPNTKMYELVNSSNKGDFIDGDSLAINSGRFGVYIENTSSNNISSVDFTINNDRNDQGIWIYTVNTEGQSTSSSEWLTLYQTTPVLGGNYTGSYNIPCNVPPGGAFIINAIQINGGEIIINKVNF